MAKKTRVKPARYPARDGATWCQTFNREEGWTMTFDSRNVRMDFEVQANNQRGLAEIERKLDRLGIHGPTQKTGDSIIINIPYSQMPALLETVAMWPEVISAYASFASQTTVSFTASRKVPS